MYRMHSGLIFPQNILVSYNRTMEGGPLTIAVLAGTKRPHCRSIKAAEYVAAFGRNLDNVEIVFVDPSEFTFPDDGNDPGGKDPRYTEIVRKADAFFIVTPEYNHGYPSTLKRMLDSEYNYYFHKPVALAGVSDGPWGGTRVCEALLPVCHRLGLINIHPEVYFPRVQDGFHENGSPRPETRDQYEKSVGAAYEELIFMAQLLKKGREGKDGAI